MCYVMYMYIYIYIYSTCHMSVVIMSFDINYMLVYYSII